LALELALRLEQLKLLEGELLLGRLVGLVWLVLGRRGG
jgi:hypothetical protein